MAKFSGSATSTQRAPLVGVRPTRTHEGGPAWEMDPKGEIFLLAAANFVQEETIYESSAVRDDRYANLVRQVTQADAKWVQGFAPYLRRNLRMRSASVVLACEYVAAGGPEGRKVVDSVCERADEPAEILAYWHSHYGRSLPFPVKKGVEDAAIRLYTERNVLKYDSSRHAMVFADVLELVHPKPKTPGQSALFKYLLDEHHHHDGVVDEMLPILVEDQLWQRVPENLRRLALEGDSVELREAGLTGFHGLPESWSWERVAGWLPGGMDAEAWQAVIPNMGVMALIRNLRNFDAKGISEIAIEQVIEKITDAEQVERSMVFPYQVWTAYREAPSDNWKRALGKTMDAACSNVPVMDGNTLVVVDCSYSMTWKLSGRSDVARMELAASMGAALAIANKSDIVVFAERNELVSYQAGSSALALTAKLHGYLDNGRGDGHLGGGTYLHTAIRDQFKPGVHQRVIIFTDDQAHDSDIDLSFVPRLYTFDLSGYGRSSQRNGMNGRFIFGGYSDATLSAVAALEAAGHTGWPFLSA
jgi:hypothetical protein